MSSFSNTIVKETESDKKNWSSYLIRKINRSFCNRLKHSYILACMHACTDMNEFLLKKTYYLQCNSVSQICSFNDVVHIHLLAVKLKVFHLHILRCSFYSFVCAFFDIFSLLFIRHNGKVWKSVKIKSIHSRETFCVLLCHYTWMLHKWDLCNGRRNRQQKLTKEIYLFFSSFKFVALLKLWIYDFFFLQLFGINEFTSASDKHVHARRHFFCARILTDS